MEQYRRGLTHFRLALSLTVKEFAKAMNLDQRTIAAWEAGKPSSLRAQKETLDLFIIQHKKAIV